MGGNSETIERAVCQLASSKTTCERIAELLAAVPSALKPAHMHLPFFQISFTVVGRVCIWTHPWIIPLYLESNHLLG